MTSEAKNTDNKSNHTPTQLVVVLIVLVAVCAAFIFTQKSGEPDPVSSTLFLTFEPTESLASKMKLDSFKALQSDITVRMNFVSASVTSPKFGPFNINKATRIQADCDGNFTFKFNDNGHNITAYTSGTTAGRHTVESVETCLETALFYIDLEYKKEVGRVQNLSAWTPSK